MGPLTEAQRNALIAGVAKTTTECCCGGANCLCSYEFCDATSLPTVLVTCGGSTHTEIPASFVLKLMSGEIEMFDGSFVTSLTISGTLTQVSPCDAAPPSNCTHYATTCIFRSAGVVDTDQASIDWSLFYVPTEDTRGAYIIGLNFYVSGSSRYAIRPTGGVVADPLHLLPGTRTNPDGTPATYFGYPRMLFYLRLPSGTDPTALAASVRYDGLGPHRVDETLFLDSQEYEVTHYPITSTSFDGVPAFKMSTTFIAPENCNYVQTFYYCVTDNDITSYIYGGFDWEG